MINPESRVWIYQSNQPLSQSQLAEIGIILNDFTKTWSAHNQALKASFELRYNRFIILIVDETQAGASGCSIDKSVRLMQELENKFNINLLDRFNIAYKIADEVKSADRNEFEQLIKDGVVSATTPVFNNMVSNYQEYQKNWETTIENSWHNRVFSL